MKIILIILASILFVLCVNNTPQQIDNDTEWIRKLELSIEDYQTRKLMVSTGIEDYELCREIYIAMKYGIEKERILDYIVENDNMLWVYGNLSRETNIRMIR